MTANRFHRLGAVGIVVTVGLRIPVVRSRNLVYAALGLEPEQRVAVRGTYPPDPPFSALRRGASPADAKAHAAPRKQNLRDGDRRLDA
jgi:hypothetical protein